MAYAILRTAKLKTMGSISSSLSHTYRTRKTTNADPERQKKNQHSMVSPETVLEAIKDQIPEKHRSDAVLCVEYLITASPEYFEYGDTEGARYFDTALQWLRDKHGKENVIAHSVHHDETSPHLIAYVVPLDNNGKLNAKAFLGGKAKLSAMQSDFAKTVSKHGLERGIEGSTATHQEIKTYYAKIKTDTAAQDVDVSQAKWHETTAAYTKRVKAEVMHQLQPQLDTAAAKAVELQETKKRLKVAEQTLNHLQTRFKPVLDALQPLSPREQAALFKMAQHNSERIIIEREKRAAERNITPKKNLLDQIKENLAAATTTLKSTPELDSQSILRNIEDVKLAQEAAKPERKQPRPKMR